MAQEEGRGSVGAGSVGAGSVGAQESALPLAAIYGPSVVQISSVPTQLKNDKSL